MTEPLIIDPQKKSWIPYPEDSDFPIQNIPLGIFSNENEVRRICSIIGDQVIDLAGLAQDGFLDPTWFQASDFISENLNALLQRGRAVTRALRQNIAVLFDENNHQIDRTKCKTHLYAQSLVSMHLPVKPGNYTDFYSSREHATNVGIMFRDPANALLPNWLHLPVGYHGRASSIVVSGTPIIRPKGQMQLKDGEAPIFGPCRQLDMELEMAFVIGKANPLGHPVPLQQADEHIHGLLLFNDWSARDIQKWEYVPLGPFLAKNFASTVSPWLVDLDALQPFRVAGPEPAVPQLEYLQQRGPGNYDIHLIASLTPDQQEENIVCRSNTKYLYWSMAQQLAHHTVNGCNMEVGDFCASGTISGSDPDSFGSFLELAWKGTKPIQLKSGNTRVFIEDGDSIRLKAYAQGNGYRIGFGEASGTILPALS